MKDPVYSEFLETVSRRGLTVEEESRLQVYLAARPELKSAWEEEVGLNRLLEQLPSVPISSNFTAQVLLALDAEAGTSTRPVARGWWRRIGWLQLAPRMALAGLVLCTGLLGYWQHQVSHRAEFAKNIAALRGVARVPTMEMLKNFDAISRLSQSPQTADLELLAALK